MKKSTIFFVALCFSCTTSQKVSKTIPLTSALWSSMNSAQGLCLVSEGKGRGHYRKSQQKKQDTIQFHFESLFSAQSNPNSNLKAKFSDEWLMVFDIAFHGEEFLRFKRKSGQVVYESSLEKKLSYDFSQLKNFGNVIFQLKAWPTKIDESTSENLFDSIECKDDKKRTDCRWKYGDLTFHYHQNSMMVENSFAQIHYKNWDSILMQFESQEWNLKTKDKTKDEKGQRDTKGDSMHLELFPENCTKF
jgi:hypothetical protein